MLSGRHNAFGSTKRKSNLEVFFYFPRESFVFPKKIGRFTCGRAPKENPFDFASTCCLINVFWISVRKVLEKKHEHNRVEIINSKTAEDRKNKQKSLVIDWNPKVKVFLSVFPSFSYTRGNKIFLVVWSRVFINYEALRKLFLI